MKKVGIVFAVASLILAIAPLVGAAVLTFRFDPNDLLDRYPTSYNQGNAVQPDARRIHEVWTSTYYATFNDNLQPGHQQPDDYNTYMNWRAGLGENEGLGSFNMWLRDDVSAPAWGEILVSNPDVPITATAAPGWNVKIDDNPWGDGQIAVWWTTDKSKYLRPGGADIGTFSFTADVYENPGLTVDAQYGVDYRIWFGDTWMNDALGVPALEFDSEGWGSLTPNYGTFAQNSAGDSGFEAILTLEAVPEPATLLIWSLLGALGAVTYWWRRK